ncbi:helicase [Oscillatoriales cyanobacterium USR001]|nr:helicase [Oscillatoriales cyanobacterium USR001]
MNEVEVHNSLLCFLRSHSLSPWPHHLTMGRLVARALRLERSALIQTGFFPSDRDRGYRVSYLMPLLMWPKPAILVTSASVQKYLLEVEIPRLQEWLETQKPIHIYPCAVDFEGLLFVESQFWLKERLSGSNGLPSGVPTIIDDVDDWEKWTRDRLTTCLKPVDWHDLMVMFPDRSALIRDTRVQLTRAIFQHPPNPYQCCLLAALEQEILHRIEQLFCTQDIPSAWRNFWQQWQGEGQLKWAEISRSQGSFSLYCAPVDVAGVLGKIWLQQPVVLIGGALDLDVKAPIYREGVGIPEITCVKFSRDRHNELIQLYVPNRLPLPNTPQFQAAVIDEIRTLLNISKSVSGLAVLIIGDVPLKAQVGAILASEFGSRVQVEKSDLDRNGILVTGWEFWREYQGKLPNPYLLAIATLPLPSLENPLVAGRVAYYKEQRKDWFRLYLLPEALNQLQRAIATVRERQGVVALFDTRVLHRSYGNQILAALSPLARIDYLDATWLT